MTGVDVRCGRQACAWTQTELAKKLEVSQGYVSLLESGARSVPKRLASKLVSVLNLRPSQLPVLKSDPLPPHRVASELGSLGYRGFEYLSSYRKLNPTELVLRALRAKHVEARFVEALPWVLVQFPDVDWRWLLSEAKQNNLQNRLGFVVMVARELAERQDKPETAATLQQWEQTLEESRLAKEDAFAGEALTNAERAWLRTNRSTEAAHWNLLTRVSADTLSRDSVG
jgi:transcriptional regulator with XRE-family HTH domain